MSRARNIKPGFFKNEDLVELPFEYRLLFIGLWTMADREGRLEERPKKIKMELFPADPVDVCAGLTELDARGFILRYEIGGKQYIQILAWKKHQNPHVKEAQSTIPPPCEHSASTVQEHDEHSASPADSLILIPDSLIQEEPPQPAAARSRGSRLPEDWKPSEELVAWARKEFPAVDLKLEIARFVDHFRSKTGRGASMLDWAATFRNWIRRSIDFSPRNVPHGTTGPPQSGGLARQPKERALAPAESRLQAQLRWLGDELRAGRMTQEKHAEQVAIARQKLSEAA